jgi:hemoglobin
MNKMPQSPRTILMNMTKARTFNRAHARIGVAALPLLLGACSVIFPPTARERARPGYVAPPSLFASSSSPSARPTATLYVRLGSMEGITAFSDDFLGRVTNDPVIIPYFKGLTDADLKRIRQHVIELLCSATGGPCTYSGKDMKTVHKDMEINNDIWNTFTGHLNESVTRFHVPDRERNELVVIIASLKKDIVNR